MINSGREWDFIDDLWNCQCGAMNAAYRQSCGKCNIRRSTKELITNLDTTKELITNLDTTWESFDMNDFLYNRDDI
tara:strand:+ start:242 stop:469 length:228 start_codon:yes stop_codon:yes gene_type:complete